MAMQGHPSKHEYLGVSLIKWWDCLMLALWYVILIAGLGNILRFSLILHIYSHECNQILDVLYSKIRHGIFSK